jgi:hypothetical protein
MRESVGPHGRRNDLDYLLVEVGRMKRAIGVALAELCRINSGSPSDLNMEIWDEFDNMGGDADALHRTIEFIRGLRNGRKAGEAKDDNFGEAAS